MTEGTIFGRFDRLFRRRITESVPDGRDGANEVRAINLADNDRLRCSMDEERAYWYEVVFSDDGRPMRVTRTTDLTDGDIEILDSVLRENRA